MSDIDKRSKKRHAHESSPEGETTAQSAEHDLIAIAPEAHAEGYVEAAKEKASEAYEGTKEAVTGAAHAVVEKATELKDAVVEKVCEARDAAAEKATQLKESVLGTVEDTRAPAEGLRDDTSGKVSKLRDLAAQKAAEYRDYASEKLEQIKENTSQAAAESKGWAAEKAEQVKHLAEEYADSLVQKSGEVQAALSPQNAVPRKAHKGCRHTDPNKEYKEHLSEYRIGEIDDEAAEEAGEFLHMAEESAEEHDGGGWGPAKGKRVRRRNRRNSRTDPEKLRKEHLSETRTGEINDEAAEEAGEFLHMTEESTSENEEGQQKGKASGKRVQRGEVGVALKDRNIPVNMMDALERKQRLSETRHIGEIDDDTAQEAGEFLHMTEESAGEDEHFKSGQAKGAKKQKKRIEKSNEFRHEVEKIEEQMPKLDNAKGWTRRR
ncbi:hypothetical protein AAVH_09857 [Aphelenchoides avenae]|nr:hypothetical protein AAVH_09857 [Aphelenchus avenae]